MPAIRHLSAAELKAQPVPPLPRPACCAYIKAPGWESLPPTFDPAGLSLVGTLRDPDYDTPGVVTEYHPDGSGFWAAHAPIAPRYFPYNQSDLWICVSCTRPFLRYAEAGGYYHEDRIRELDPALVIDAQI